LLLGPTVRLKRGLHHRGGAKAPSAALMIARAIVDAKREKLPCRVLNPTEKPIKLRSGTTKGIIAPVTVHSTVTAVKTQNKQRGTMTQMMKILADKKIIRRRSSAWN